MQTTIIFNDIEDLVDIKIEENDGSVVLKKITMNNLAELFKVKESKNYYLLANIFRNSDCEEHIEGLIFGNSDERSCKGIFFIPEDIHCMNMAGEKLLIPYPSLIFAIKAKDGIIKDSKCYAVKERKIDDIRKETSLYAYPFGNVQAGTGDICWGSNNLPYLKDVKDLQRAMNIFYGSASNLDYVKTGKSYSASYGSYQQFLKKLTELEKFPLKALVKSPAYKTLNDLIVSF